MSRKFPLCAHCGEHLDGAWIRLECRDTPGLPVVGWHDNCACADKACTDLRKGLCHAAKQAVLREIEARGPGRLSVTRKWAANILSMCGAP